MPTRTSARRSIACVLAALGITAAQAATTAPRFPAPAVQTGLTVTFNGHKLTVAPGSAYVNDKLVTISVPTELKVDTVPNGRLAMDVLYVTTSGTIGLGRGQPAKHAPEPAVPPKDSLALAHIVVEGSSPLSDKSILPLSRDSARVYFANRPFNLRALSNTIAKLKANQPVRILFWGDSVTVGANASKPELSFAQLTVKMLKERFHDDNITVKNDGVPGSDASQRVGTLEAELQSFKPDLVVIEFVNDLRLKSPTRENVWSQAHDLIDKAGAEVVWVNPFLPTPILWAKLQDAGGTKDWMDEAKAPYFQLVREKTQEYGWALADCTKRWEHLDQEGLRPDLLLEDGIIHPNDLGHRMIAEEIVKCFH